MRYDDLVVDPAGTVAQIYARFSFDLNPAYAEILQAEAVRAQQNHGRHAHSLEGTGLTGEGIVACFQDVFDRFAFSAAGPHEQPGLPYGQLLAKLYY